MSGCPVSHQRLDFDRINRTAIGALPALVARWLPDGKRPFVLILPGIVITLIAWVVSAVVFAAYLSRFANYFSTYAGLASIMVALVFLYILAAIFIVGAEINAAINLYADSRKRLSRR